MIVLLLWLDATHASRSAQLVLARLGAGGGAVRTAVRGCEPIGRAVTMMRAVARARTQLRAPRAAAHRSRLLHGSAVPLAADRLTGGVGDTGVGKDWAGHGKSSWDSDTQTFHAGQDWMQLTEDGIFIEDFSVTTNAFGTPKAAEEAAAKACSLMHHYPPADFEPALTDLAKFLWPDGHEEGHSRLLMGNVSPSFSVSHRNCSSSSARPPDILFSARHRAHPS